MLLMSSLSIKLCLGILLTLLLAGGIALYWIPTYVGPDVSAIFRKHHHSKNTTGNLKRNRDYDSITAWEKTFGPTPMWSEGLYLPVHLPANATAQEVLQMVRVTSSRSMECETLDIRSYGPTSFCPNGTAVLLENESGDRFVFITIYEGKNTWACRFYPSWPE